MDRTVNRDVMAGSKCRLDTRQANIVWIIAVRALAVNTRFIADVKAFSIRRQLLWGSQVYGCNSIREISEKAIPLHITSRQFKFVHIL
jgi:hypothetical protein